MAYHANCGYIKVGGDNVYNLEQLLIKRPDYAKKIINEYIKNEFKPEKSNDCTFNFINPSKLYKICNCAHHRLHDYISHFKQGSEDFTPLSHKELKDIFGKKCGEYTNKCNDIINNEKREKELREQLLHKRKRKRTSLYAMNGDAERAPNDPKGSDDKGQKYIELDVGGDKEQQYMEFDDDDDIIRFIPQEQHPEYIKETLQGKIDDLQRELDKSKRSIDNLQNESSEKSIQINDLLRKSERCDDLQNNIDDLRSKSERCDDLQTKLDNCNTRSNQRQLTLQKYVKECDVIKNKLRRFQETVFKPIKFDPRRRRSVPFISTTSSLYSTQFASTFSLYSQGL